MENKTKHPSLHRKLSSLTFLLGLFIYLRVRCILAG